MPFRQTRAPGVDLIAAESASPTLRLLQTQIAPWDLADFELKISSSEAQDRPKSRVDQVAVDCAVGWQLTLASGFHAAPADCRLNLGRADGGDQSVALEMSQHYVQSKRDGGLGLGARHLGIEPLH